MFDLEYHKYIKNITNLDKITIKGSDPQKQDYSILIEYNQNKLNWYYSQELNHENLLKIKYYENNIDRMNTAIGLNYKRMSLI